MSLLITHEKYTRQIFFLKPVLSILLLVICGYYSYAAPYAPANSLIAAQKAIIAEKNVDSASFYKFAALCEENHEADLLMNTYRQIVESGQKDIVKSDLPFLQKLNSEIDTNKLNENSFHICYYLARITNKYHLDSTAPLLYNQQAVSIAIKLKDVCLTVKGYQGMSSYYMNIKHDLLKANECNVLVNEVLQKAHKNGLIDCNTDENMGFSTLYYYLEDYAKGIEYLNKSIASVKLIKKPQRLFDLYYRRNLFEMELKQYEKALATIDTARMVVKNEPNRIKLYNFLKADSFNIYIALNDYDKAVSLNKGIILKDLDGSDDEYYDYLLNLVKLNIHSGQYADAEQNINLYTATLKEWNIQRWRNAYQMKYTLSKAQNHTADALKYYEEYTKYNDLVYHQGQNYAVIAQQIKYDTQQKEEALKLQIAANLAEKRKANFIIVAAIAVCLLLLLLLAYRINRELTEKNRLNRSFAKKLIQNTEKEQHRLANELHDGLGQELLLLKNSLIQQKDSIKAAHVGEIIESVRGMARELYPALLEVIGLEAAIKNQLQKIDEQESIFISSEIDLPGKLNSHTQLQVYRIFQEAMTNVLKYAQATSVLVELKEEGNILTLRIKDNGVGFEPEEKAGIMSGFGLQSMKQRAESISGFFKVNSAKNKGTEITLSFNRDENISS